MLKIAKTATFILAAMTPFLGIAQRSQDRVDRKQGPTTTATPARVAGSGAQVNPGSQHFVTSENFFRANSKSNAGPRTALPVPAQSPVVRPPAQPNPATPQVAAPAAIATFAPAGSAEPVVNPRAGDAIAAVHYAEGQLTVSAQNVSLGRVLKLISAKTGAKIDLAPELQNEPVIAQIGPGALREVLTGLLDSPRIDYIIMGAGDAAGGVERIVVRTRQSFARTAMAGGRASQPRPQDLETATGSEDNDRPATGVTTAAAPMTQEQLMENWKKIREEKRLAEIEQQKQDRENEKTQVQVELQPQSEPEPDNPPADNPTVDHPPMK
jgi:hypothetical protein